jgi:hypothetical protein
MADDISPVNLPPIASTGEAGSHDSRRGSNDRNKKNKIPDKSKDDETGSNKAQDKEKNKDKDNGGGEPKGREKRSPSADVNFERTEHELDSFA